MTFWVSLVQTTKLCLKLAVVATIAELSWCVIPFSVYLSAFIQTLRN